MAQREPWYISSGRRSEVRHKGRAVIRKVTPEQRMRAGEIVVQTNHTVVLVRGTLIGCDQVSSSIPIVSAIRRGKQGEEGLYARISRNRDATTWRRTRAGDRIIGSQQQSPMLLRARDARAPLGRPDF